MPLDEPSLPRPGESLRALGFDDEWYLAACRAARHLTTPVRGRPLPPQVHLALGRVGRAGRGGCDVLAAAGPVRCTWGADVVAASGTDPEATPATGDWVVLARWPDDRATVEVVLPRRASVRRAQVAAGSSRAQVLAANVDVVAVVEALVPDPDAGRLERLLSLAWASGAAPVVVLTKSDLVPQPEHLVTELSAVAPGCDVLPVAAPSGQGVAAVRELLGGARTLALLGASGVGKSTLVNAVVGGEVMRTRSLRADGRGRHTTATRELHPVGGGGALIDTPGLRSVGLVGAEVVGDVFADVEALAAGCRFRDCSHANEPGCAVLDAVDAGRLPMRRLASYRKLHREVEYQASRTDARLRAERARRWRLVQSAARARGHRP